MNSEQKKQCQVIIHTHAAAAAAGNFAPLPTVGFAVDTVAMTAMSMSLCAVFGGDIPKEVAKGMAISALRRTVLKHPVKSIAKELSKIIPGLGQVVAPTISVIMIEAAGWTLARELEACAHATA